MFAVRIHAEVMMHVLAVDENDASSFAVQHMDALQHPWDRTLTETVAVEKLVTSYYVTDAVSDAD
jgi:hypothetical protein